MKTKRILISLLCLLICALMLSSCDILLSSLSTDSSSDSSSDTGVGGGFNTSTSTDTSTNIGSLEGVSLSSAYINDKGELILIYTNGTEQNLGVVVGKDGDVNVNVSGSGSDVGYAVSSALKSSVSVSCSYTSGSGFNATTYGSSGSGVIFKVEHGKAFIITNYHVVYDVNSNTSNKISNDIKVLLYGAEYQEHLIDAEYVGGAANYDIAVIAIDSSNLNGGAYGPCKIADSNAVCVGDTAIAVGNPEGDGISATSGIVSVDSEEIDVDIINDGVSSPVELRVMRIDTAVNPGNSGGGLFDKNGKLIGIVNAKTSDDTIEGIGYAIPSNIAYGVAQNIIDNCYGKANEFVKKPMLGITITISETKAVTNSEGRVVIEQEVYVTDVVSGGIAYGIFKANDVIKSVRINDGKTISVTRQFHVIDHMLNARVGDTIYTVVERNGVEMTLEVNITASSISTIN